MPYLKLFHVYSGEEFNKLTEEMEFVKFTNASETHNGYEFHTGINVDSVEFNPKGECLPGGIYFTSKEKEHLWLQGHVYFRSLIIPGDARVYVENDKYKVDKLILGERQEILKNQHYCELIVLFREPSWIKFVDNQTPELCLAAVKRDGMSLGDVREQTEEICEAALQQNGDALRLVKKQTPKLCLIAVNNKSLSLLHVKEQTLEICLAAVTKYDGALEYVSHEFRKECIEELDSIAKYWWS